MSTNAPEQQWEKLVGQFRQLCLFRRQKKLIESDMILTSELPRSIASWSQSFDGEPAVKKSRLDAMFQTEQRRIDDAWLVQELVTARFTDQFIPEICSQVAQEVRVAVAEEMAAQDRRPQRPAGNFENAAARNSRPARVVFDDIPGVIDQILAEDRDRAHARRMETVVCQ